MKYFNTAGPCITESHYLIDPLTRNPDIESLTRQGFFYNVYAARQSGKTTIMQHIAEKLNSEGKYYVLYCSLEAVQSFNNPEKGIPEIVNQIEFMLQNLNFPFADSFTINSNPDKTSIYLQQTLTQYCKKLDRPFIVFFDEADCLSDETLITFLRQLRSGYINRGSVPFLHSCALIGMRNIRDYKDKVLAGNPTLGSASPFNVVTEAVSFKSFDLKMITDLYNQHTLETGQIFEPEAIDKVMYYTNGQAWLVNAIARECVVKITNNDFARNITAAMVETAKENIILRRDTHIDSLLARLKEPRVRNVMEKILIGSMDIEPRSDDTYYCCDLGLIYDNAGEFTPTNYIYKEIIIRTLNYDTQYNLVKTLENKWIKPDKSVDMNGLLQAFQQFWRENSDIWVNKYDYKEAAPHLILQAFLQRIINGGGSIDREYATGRMRMDLCVRYAGNKYPIEIKIWYSDKTRLDGITQLQRYMDTLGESKGWLVIFDRKRPLSWDQKIYWDTLEINHKTIHVVGG